MHDTITSKKLWFAVGVCILAFAFCILASTKLPDMKSLFDGFTGILEFVTGAYLTGNIANKWVASKAEAGTLPTLPQIGKKKLPPAQDPLDRDVPSGSP